MKSTIGGLMDMLAERAIKSLRDEIHIGGVYVRFAGVICSLCEYGKGKAYDIC